MQSPEKPNDEAEDQASPANAAPAANPFERTSAWGRVVPDAPIRIARPTQAALDAAARRPPVAPRANMPPKPGPGLQLLSVPNPAAPGPNAPQQRPPGLLTAPTPAAPAAGTGIFGGSATRPARPPAPRPTLGPVPGAPRPVPAPSRPSPSPVQSAPVRAPVAPEPAAQGPAVEAVAPQAVAPEPAFAAALSMPRQPRMAPKRSPWPMAAAAVGVVALIGAAVWFASRKPEAPAAPVLATAVAPQAIAPAPAAPVIDAAPAAAPAQVAPAPVSQPAPASARVAAPAQRRTVRAEAPVLRPAPAAEPAAAPVIAVPPPAAAAEPPPAAVAPPSPPPVPIVREPAPDPDSPMTTQRPERE